MAILSNGLSVLSVISLGFLWVFVFVLSMVMPSYFLGLFEVFFTDKPWKLEGLNRKRLFLWCVILGSFNFVFQCLSLFLSFFVMDGSGLMFLAGGLVSYIINLVIVYWQTHSCRDNFFLEGCGLSRIEVFFSSFIMWLVWLVSFVTIYVVTKFHLVEGEDDIGWGFLLRLLVVGLATLAPGMVWVLVSDQGRKFRLALVVASIFFVTTVCVAIYPVSGQYILYRTAGLIGLRESEVKLSYFDSVAEGRWLRGKVLLDMGGTRLVCPTETDFNFSSLEAIRVTSKSCLLVNGKPKFDLLEKALRTDSDMADGLKSI
ncbi:hypothetical protein SAMN05216571_104347 [Onishia taeanensis]|uniref:Uncharacterized protein n=2 Tax=Onishia taeanensis TaxID=284577 RepID=A0A1G7RLX5_9GAMM|nr:hypothetical protein SAMN05216571_104347 [Halomonas taeanensis]